MWLIRYSCVHFISLVRDLLETMNWDIFFGSTLGWILGRDPQGLLLQGTGLLEEWHCFVTKQILTAKAGGISSKTNLVLKIEASLIFSANSSMSIPIHLSARQYTTRRKFLLHIIITNLVPKIETRECHISDSLQTNMHILLTLRSCTKLALHQQDYVCDLCRKRRAHLFQVATIHLSHCGAQTPVRYVQDWIQKWVMVFHTISLQSRMQECGWDKLALLTHNFL